MFEPNRSTAPTRAGMARPVGDGLGAASDSAHAGGDGSAPRTDRLTAYIQRPRGRGWLGIPAPTWPHGATAPTRAGMARSQGPQLTQLLHSAHAGGDGSNLTRLQALAPRQRPRGRGWLGRPVVLLGRQLTAPTRAGMAREPVREHLLRLDSAHAGGDGSRREDEDQAALEQRPRGRGWLDAAIAHAEGRPTAPTRAGMARYAPLTVRVPQDSAHAGGDGSAKETVQTLYVEQRPRGRGWLATGGTGSGARCRVA